MDGFIIVDSLEDIVNACNSLTTETYESKISAVEENFEKSKKFATISDRLIEKIEEILK